MKGNFAIKWENSESQHLRLPGIQALLNNTDLTSLRGVFELICFHFIVFHCLSVDGALSQLAQITANKRGTGVVH